MINLLHSVALAEIQALKDLAKEMGIQEGPDLTAFLRDERARAREERQADNRAREQKHALRLAEIQREAARETADRQDAIRMREGELADRRAAMRTMPKLQPFDDKNDDMDAFIRRFESYAVSLEWPKRIGGPLI